MNFDIMGRIFNTNKFIIILHFLVIFTILLSLIILFNFIPIMKYFPNAIYDFLDFNDNLFNKIPINEILFTMVGGLSAILAIVFSLTIISIQNISEKYTPFILNKFIKNHHISRLTLYTFIFVILSALLLLYVKELLHPITVIICFLILLYGFLICFILLIKYFYFIFDIINPIEFARILKDEVLEYIKTEKRELVEPIITTMGDISIKSLEKQEKNISKKYISQLYEIFLQSISENQKFGYLDLILDSYQRILEYCIRINSELRFKILDVYAEIPIIFHLIKKFEKDIFDNYINYLDKLFFANKEIINNNDFELFASEIDSISLRFIDDPKQLLEEIKNQLIFNFNLIKPDEIINKNNEINRELENILKNYSDLDIYSNILKHLDDYFSLIPESMDRFDRIKDNLFKFYLDSNFHNTFFIIGAYCLFVQKEKDINSVKYIRELWLHTNPDDASGISVNQVPVTMDIEFLFNMLFWGGKKSDFWYDHYRFDGFHGSKAYLYTYFILLLTHLREKHNKDLNLQINKDMEKEILELRYTFMKRFILEIQELKNYCDDLIKESKNWVYLFPSKKQEVEPKSKLTVEAELIEISTEDQFNNTKKWLEYKAVEFKQKIDEIEIYLPLENEKVDIYKNDILKSYTKFSKISKSAVLKEFEPSKDDDIEFIPIGYRPIIPKHFFLAASYVDCSALWFGYGKKVAFKEINYFIKKILEIPNIEKIDVDNFENIIEVYDKIESTINLLKDEGFNPSTIIIPLDYLSKFHLEGMNKESKLFGKFEFSYEQFTLNGSTKLDIIHSSNSVKFDDIIILDKETCIWTFKPTSEDKERLHIEIKEFEKDLSKIDLTLKSIINLKIENIDAIKIIIIKKMDDGRPI
ncbi:MAG: DUF2254 domain-containing protein [Methanosarcinales archaeon]|nr:DUF2254 domain-containing protein [Methanosarcinales archaeon]